MLARVCYRYPGPPYITLLPKGGIQDIDLKQVQNGILLKHYRFGIFKSVAVQGAFANLRQAANRFATR